MPAISLKELALKACIKQVVSINDFGDAASYSLIRPILLKVEYPEQLLEIERSSPQIIGDDEELWISFIKRDVPDGENKIVRPKNPANWYKIYRKMMEANKAGLTHDIEALKATLRRDKNEKAKHVSRLVDSKTLPKLPRMYGMRVEKTNNTFGKTPDASFLSFSSGSKTKTLTGKGVLNKARREARELSLFSTRKALLATPTHKLQEKASKIRTVPETYINDHRKAAAAPKVLSQPAVQAAKTPAAAPAQLAGQKRSIAYLEESDDEDDVDNDPLFSEPAPENRERRPVVMKRPTTKPSAAAQAAPQSKRSLLSHFSQPLSKASKVSTAPNTLPSLISPPMGTKTPKARAVSVSRVPTASSQSTQGKAKATTSTTTSKTLSPPSETAQNSSHKFSPEAAGTSQLLAPPRKLPAPQGSSRPRAPVSVFMPQKRRKVGPR